MENDREKSEKNKTTKNKQTKNKTKQNKTAFLLSIGLLNHEPRLGQVLPWSQPISTTLYSVVNTKLANTWTYMQIPP